MEDKRVIIEDKSPQELYKTLKYRMIDAGMYPGDPDLLDNGLQFKFYCGNSSHIIRIEALNEEKSVVDLSFITDSETDYLVRQFLPSLLTEKGKTSPDSVFMRYNLKDSDCIVGLDEAGKEDYFGPIVVTAVTYCKNSLNDLVDLNLKDAQFYNKENIRRISKQIREIFPTTSIILSPELYNEMYIRHKDLELILLKAHVRAMKESTKKHKASVAIINPFSRQDLSTQIMGNGALQIVQPMGQARHPVIFAAGIVSRAVFHREMDGISEEYRFNFVTGTGDDVVSTAKSFIKSYGLENLFKVAKVNFKLTGSLI